MILRKAVYRHIYSRTDRDRHTENNKEKRLRYFDLKKKKMLNNTLFKGQCTTCFFVTVLDHDKPYGNIHCKFL